MVDERYNFLIGIGLDQSSAAQAVSQTRSTVKEMIQAAQQAAKASGGILSSDDAERYLEKIRRGLTELARQTQTSGVGSNTAQDRIQRLQTKVRNADIPDSSGPLARAETDYIRALRQRERVLANAEVPIGGKSRQNTLSDEVGGGKITARAYKDDAARTDAKLDVQKIVDKTAETVKKLRLQQAEAIAKEIADEEKAHQAILDGLRKEQEALGRATLAINRREDQDARRQATDQRRSGAEQAGDFTAAERARQYEAARQFAATPVTYPNADQSTRVGRAQEAYNIAERNVAAAEQRLADENNNRNQTVQSLKAAQNGLSAATRSLGSAQETLSKETIRARDEQAALNRVVSEETVARKRGLAGVGQQFGLGFRGASDRPFAEQLGQAFKFSAFYGTAYKLLFGITQTFQQTLQEGIGFQQAVTELKLATGATTEQAEALANSFGETATQYGFSSSQAALIGARAQGYYGTTDADLETQRRVGTTSARVVNQIAFNSGLQPDDIQSNLAAVTQAYQLGPQSQTYIADLDAYFSRKLGAGPGQTIQAVSQAGVVGRAAGFSPAEVSALAADIISRTGASPDSAGGYLTQIFTRAGEGQLTNLTRRYGIDQSEDFASQFRALAEVYKNNPDQRDDIAAGFGRGKAQAAAISILQDFDNISSLVEKSKTDAPGELERSSQARLGDVGGQIQQTIGSLREFANQLSQTGILDGVGAAVVGLRDLVDAGTTLLREFNQLSHTTRDVILGLAALATATRVAGATEIGTQLFGGGFRGGARYAGAAAFERFGTGTGVQILRSGGSAYALQSESRLATIGRGAGTAGIVGFGRGASVGSNLRAGAVGARGAYAGLASGVGGLGVLAAFAGDAVLISKMVETTKKFNDARRDYFDFTASDDYDLTTADGQTAAADAAKNLANQQKDASEGIFARLKNRGADSDEAKAREAAANREFDRYTANAKLISDYNQRTAGAPAGLITDFSTDNISSNLDALSSSGGSAAQQMNLLAKSVDAVGLSAMQAANNYDPKVLAASYSDKLFDSLEKYPGFSTGTQPSAAGSGLNAVTKRFGITPVKATDTTDETFSKLFSPDQFQYRLEQGLGTIKSIDELSDPDKVKAVIAKTVGNLPERQGKKQGLSDDVIASIRAKFEKRVANILTLIQGDVKSLDDTVVLSDDQLTFLSNNILTLLDQDLAGRATNDYSGRRNSIQRRVAQLRDYIAHTPKGEDNQTAQLDLANIRSQLAQNDVDQAEALRKVAQRNATSLAGAQAQGRKYLAQELRAVVRNGNGDQLATILGQAGKGAVSQARSMIEDALAIAQVAKVFDAAIGGVLGAFGLDSPQLTGDRKEIRRLKKLIGTLSTTASATDSANVYDGSGVFDAAADGDTAGDVAAARAAAEAARKGGQIAPAQAAIVAAKNSLAAAKKNSVAYYNALESLYTAQQQLTAALIDYRKNKFLLAHDLTDPLDQARAEVIAAAATLRAAVRRGAGGDELASDRVALQQAQANQESTAFSQRLEAVQTADDLGRISHSKYLDYLQHEHDRLEGIKNRTYQQQEQLDQIDKLMKDAANEMQGQFNFGDIKLPTPYEVRRRIAEEAEAIKNPSGNATNNVVSNGFTNPNSQAAAGSTYISIDGADVAKVRAILTDVLGKRATTTTTSPRHR